MRRVVRGLGQTARGFTRSSLKWQLTVGSLALATAILAVTWAGLSSTAAQAAAKEADAQADRLAGLFAELVAEPLAAEDRMQLHVLGSTFVEGGVRALCVRGPEGEILFPRDTEDAAWPESSEAPPPGVTFHEARDAGLVRKDQDVEFGGNHVGRVTLWIERVALERRILSANAVVYPTFATGFVLLLALGIAALHTPFRAMRRLTGVAERIGRGDLSVRVPVRGTDEVASFCGSFNRMVDGLAQARDELLRKHLQTIQAMISSVEAKDRYTQGHCLRVREYARQILDALGGLPKDLREQIETAALLHDVGKIGVPDHVLLKKGPLTEEEFLVVQTHVTIGEHILLHIDSLRDIARWVRHHHERWDGLGYPNGLRGHAIPLASRIIAVADCTDALLTSRPYREALGRDDVVRVLEEGRGSQFDPALVDHALEALDPDRAADAAAAEVHELRSAVEAPPAPTRVPERVDLETA